MISSVLAWLRDRMKAFRFWSFRREFFLKQRILEEQKSQPSRRSENRTRYYGKGQSAHGRRL